MTTNDKTGWNKIHLKTGSSLGAWTLRDRQNLIGRRYREGVPKSIINTLKKKLAWTVCQKR